MTEPPPQRRVLQPATGKDERRSGCITLGAVLGVVVGAIFAFYGLPPILRHYYGEKHVTAGHEYTAGGTTLRVLGLYAGFDPICIGTNVAGTSCPDVIQVTLAVKTSSAWAPAPADFLLELKEQHDWIEALAPPAGLVVEPGVVSEFSFGFAAGADRMLLLRFAVPAGLATSAVTPVRLHSASPRVKFALPEPRR